LELSALLTETKSKCVLYVNFIEGKTQGLRFVLSKKAEQEFV